MTALVLIQNEDDLPFLVPKALQFAQADDLPLVIVCWTYSPLTKAIDSNEEDSLAETARQFVADNEMYSGIVIEQIHGPDLPRAFIQEANQQNAELLVARYSTGTKHEQDTRSLPRLSPCNIILLTGNPVDSSGLDNIFVAATDNSNDSSALYFADLLARRFDSKITLARAEFEDKLEGMEIGRRELSQLVRESNIDSSQAIELNVFASGDHKSLADCLADQDLIFIGNNSAQLPTIRFLSTRSTIAIVKHAPPLKSRKRGAHSWKPRLSPADYAELIQGLRHGSRLSIDFVVMLGLAAVVASVGLLQNSPAVVIGSMLLAPLMTPIVGCGLALAQANKNLGRTALRTVAIGLVYTLTISWLIGFFLPGAELTPQVYARGAPTVIDLIVAVASAGAAAYAMARPNLVGSIAGVAIATALVPPLCSVGLSLAYQDLSNAQGAALLFVTNFLAIVLTTATTFRLIGITAYRADRVQKLWVGRVVSVFCFSVILVCIPLHHGLMKSLVESKPQPRAYPLAKSVIDALQDHMDSKPNVHLITAGRPSSKNVSADVVIVIGASENLDRSFGQELTQIVRQSMKDDSLEVDVHCVKQLW